MCLSAYFDVQIPSLGVDEERRGIGDIKKIEEVFCDLSWRR